MSIKTEFNNLQSKLRPLNLYSLYGTTLVDAELKSYASGIEILNEALSTMERENFITTAISYGLIEREKILGGVKVDTDIQNRRDMLNYRFAITANDFSKNSIQKDLIACGLNANIVENLDGESIYINCNGVLNDFTTENQAIKSAQEFLPAHLEANFDFRILTWDYIDEQENTFNEMDNANMTWNDIDTYQEIL